MITKLIYVGIGEYYPNMYPSPKIVLRSCQMAYMNPLTYELYKQIACMLSCTCDDICQYKAHSKVTKGVHKIVLWAVSKHLSLRRYISASDACNNALIAESKL